MLENAAHGQLIGTIFSITRNLGANDLTQVLKHLLIAIGKIVNDNGSVAGLHQFYNCMRTNVSCPAGDDYFFHTNQKKRIKRFGWSNSLVVLILQAFGEIAKVQKCHFLQEYQNFFLGKRNFFQAARVSSNI